MTSGFQRLERELLAAVERAERHRLRHRVNRLRAGMGGGLVTAVVLGLSLLVLVGAIAWLHARPTRTSATQPTGLPAKPPSRSAACLGAGTPHRPINPASPDRRLMALLAVFRRPPTSADRTAAARCVSAETRTDPRYVRYVGPGILGGEVFITPYRSGSNIPGVPRGQPGVCIATVNAPPIAGQLGGCTSLRDIRNPPPSFSAGEIFPGPGGQSTFTHARIPPSLQHGSLLGGVLRDGIASVEVDYGARKILTVPVRNNIAYFHVNHSAPVAANLQLVFKDAHGRTVK